MEVRAVGKFIRVPPRKARLVVDQVRGLPAAAALNSLKFMPNEAARLVSKVLSSAVANAENNHKLSADSLKIERIFVDEGPRMKRIQPRAMGRAFRILKRMSHITVILEDSIVPQPKKKRVVRPAKPKPASVPAEAPPPPVTPVVAEVAEPSTEGTAAADTVATFVPEATDATAQEPETVDEATPTVAESTEPISEEASAETTTEEGKPE